MSEAYLGSGMPKFQERHDGSRVFIQLSENAGCPIGCKYCYIPRLGEKAQPIRPEDMSKRLTSLTEDERFTDDTAISIGCDTDPFLPDITPVTAQVLDFFKDRNNPIQIASKLLVPPEVRKAIKDRGSDKSAVMLSVSITALRSAALIEPGAPLPWERATNFLLSPREDNIYPIAMMKPYRRGTVSEVDGFVNLYAELPPQSIIIGKLIAKAREADRKTYPPFALDPSRHHMPLPDEAMDFASRLKEGLEEKGICVPIHHSAAEALFQYTKKRG